MNESRTCGNSDTLLARLGSLDVPMPTPRGPLVYFVRRGDEIKIGFTHRLSQRMAGLGGALTLLGIVPGTTTTERMYHERFTHLRTQGEWFRAGPDLLAAIDAECDTESSRPTYQDIAKAFMRAARRNLDCGNSGLIHAQTDVGFRLNALAMEETPERLSALEIALSAFQKAKCAQNAD